MGTSSGYSPPTGGDWNSLKRHLRSLSDDTTNDIEAKKVVSKFIKAIGGAEAFAAGRRPTSSSGGGSQKSYSSAAARRISSNVLSFISDTSKSGLQQALIDRGLIDLKGKSLGEIKEALIGFFSEPAVDGDAEAASRAVAKVFEDIFDRVESEAEVESIFSNIISPDESEMFLCSFYEHYLYELFARTFFEEMMSKFGREKSIELSETVQDTIKAKIQRFQCTKDLSKIDFNSPEGQTFVQGILQNILEILEDENE
ncbi:hypothetical protein [Sulfuricurvum sp.]|uniref:hypothetical protein n=1 Tax=Sulfuricurvum sp. TaxID=2025608 RepID=UPI00260A8734|nr:hypothetical protein [Sulfuricurvum sp.]MDD3597019.1 hypothetical protein [Sulfuricurvum sp.]